MDCVNHPGVSATAYCQNCGKAMCAACTRKQAGGQILCEPCSMVWQNVQAPFAAPPTPGAPNPVLAALLGFIPGVGAMYNGQFVKGFIHVAVFALLVSLSDHHNIFGLFVAAWILYQAFEAHHTAKARRDGEPLPDPLGLNELASWFHTGIQTEFRRAHGVPPPPVPGQTAGAVGAAQPQPPAAGQVPTAGGYVPPYQAPYANPYQTGYRPPPFTGAPPAAGFTGYPPPPAGFGPGYPGYGPAVPPARWRRPEPIAAIVLIGMGVLFLLGQVSWFSGRMFEFTWPLLLIGLGAWLLFRRMNDVRPRPGAMPPAAPPPENPEGAQHDKDSQGGTL
jgi:Domain of unknown function (DUF5668)